MCIISNVCAVRIRYAIHTIMSMLMLMDSLSKHSTFTMHRFTLVPLLYSFHTYFNSRLEFSHIHFISYWMLGTYSTRILKFCTHVKHTYAHTHTPKRRYAGKKEYIPNYKKKFRHLTCAFVWPYSIRVYTYMYIHKQCARYRAPVCVCARLTFINYVVVFFFISTGFRLYMH